MVDRFEFRNGFSAQIEHGEVAAGFQLCHHAPFEEIEGVERDCPRFSAEFQPHDPERLFRYTGFPLLFFYTRVGCGGVDDGGISSFGLFQGKSEGASLPVMDDGGNGERFFCGGEVQDHFAAAERLGIRIHLLEFPRGFSSRFSLEEQNEFLKRELEKRKYSGVLENPLLDLGVGEPLDRGFSLLGHPCVIHSAEPAENGCFNFFQTVNRQMERLLKNSSAHKKYCIEMDTVLKKRRSGF